MMEFYIFSNDISDVKELIKYKYSGALFVYNTFLVIFLLKYQEQ